jgi:hypothetical protein
MADANQLSSSCPTCSVRCFPPSHFPPHPHHPGLQDQVDKKVCLAAPMLREAIDRVRGAVMICYPMGLPEYDFIREALEDREDLAGSNVSSTAGAGAQGARQPSVYPGLLCGAGYRTSSSCVMWQQR